MDRIEKQCIDKGMRMTDQRRVVARVLSAAEDHPDVEELYHRAAAVDPNISLATVYRTVRLFEEAGNDHHDHLINIKTGQVVEFYDKEIEQMKEALAEKLGYKLVGHKLELYGVPLGEEK